MLRNIFLAIVWLNQKHMQNRYGEFSEAVLTKWYANYNIYELFKQLPEAKKNEVAWFIACGDDDALSVNNMNNLLP